MTHKRYAVPLRTHIQIRILKPWFEASNPKSEVNCVQVKLIHSKYSIHMIGSKKPESIHVGIFSGVKNDQDK
jgi:hypothetical protein